MIFPTAIILIVFSIIINLIDRKNKKISKLYQNNPSNTCRFTYDQQYTTLELDKTTIDICNKASEACDSIWEHRTLANAKRILEDS